MQSGYKRSWAFSNSCSDCANRLVVFTGGLEKRVRIMGYDTVIDRRRYMLERRMIDLDSGKSTKCIASCRC